MTPPFVTEVRAGRRWFDWHIIAKDGKSVAYYLFGMLLDETGKPSMARWMLLLWTWTGWLMIRHELRLKVGDPSLQNPVWTSWWAAEGFIGLAVFGPRIASYFGAGAAGAVTGIGSSIRDALTTITAKVDSIHAGAGTQVNVNPAPAPTETPVPDSLEGKG
jgi:hypothetical protein